MMKQRRILFVMLLILSFMTPNLIGEAASEEKERYILTYDQEDTQFLSSIGAENIHEWYPMISAVTVSLTEDQANQLKNVKAIKSITKEQVVKIDGQLTGWGMKNTKVDIAQQKGKTGEGIKVAVLDTGIDKNHIDLSVVDGICFAVTASGSSACPDTYMDDHGHGTHVAGIIGARHNNIGVVGVAPNVSLYAVKVLDADGVGVTSAVLNGMEWAINQEVDIINLSLTTEAHDPALKLMMDYAYSQGILVVAAAGNQGNYSGIGDTAEYPGKYSSVISVAATDYENKRIPESATGPSIEMAAPGDGVYSTIPVHLDVYDGNQDGYTYMTGTSMAAPYVSGILALYKEQFPTKSHEEIRNMLAENAIDLGTQGRDFHYGYGLVQANTEGEDVQTLQVDVSTEKGTAFFTVPSLEEGESYDVYRDGILIEENVTEKYWIDYVLKGTYRYEFKKTVGDDTLVTERVATITSPHFVDLSNHDWFAREIVYLNKYGIMNGYMGDKMKPSQYVKRGEAMAMVGRAIGLDGKQRSTEFKDVSANYFASGYIQSAYEQGIIAGFPDRTFRPTQYVTRAEMAILLSNAYQLIDAPPASFSDVTPQVTGYEAINKIAYENITKGYPDGTFKPFEKITRANFAVFVARAENDLFK